MTEGKKDNNLVETKSFEEQKVELFETFKSTLLRNKEFVKANTRDIFADNFRPFDINIRFATKSGIFTQLDAYRDSDDTDSNEAHGQSTILLLNQEARKSSKRIYEFSKELHLQLFRTYDPFLGSSYQFDVTFIEDIQKNKKDERIVYKDSPEALQKAKDFLKEI
jgi:hypothetical protein